MPPDSSDIQREEDSKSLAANLSQDLTAHIALQRHQHEQLQSLTDQLEVLRKDSIKEFNKCRNDLASHNERITRVEKPLSIYADDVYTVARYKTDVLPLDQRLSALETHFARNFPQSIIPLVTAEEKDQHSSVMLDLLKSIAFHERMHIEIRSARQKYPPLVSIQEAYTVILKQIDDLRRQVFQKGRRDVPDILKQLVQIATMSCRAAEDLHLMDPDKARIAAAPDGAAVPVSRIPNP